MWKLYQYEEESVVLQSTSQFVPDPPVTSNSRRLLPLTYPLPMTTWAATLVLYLFESTCCYVLLLRQRYT
jgi:hypothetical protein